MLPLQLSSECCCNRWCHMSLDTNCMFVLCLQPSSLLWCKHSTGNETVPLHVRNLNILSFVLQDIDWTKPSCLIFGNEDQGISEEALAAADQTVVIPMNGFADSFNISVAASIILYEARQQRIRLLGAHSTLTEHQQRILTAVMMLRNQVCTLTHRILCSCIHVDLSRTKRLHARAPFAHMPYV